MFFLTLPALSDTAENPCEKIESSQQIAQCAEYKKDQSDKTLNLYYKETLDRIKHQYKESPALSEQYLSLLRGAQREWIKLRDADCKLEAFEIEETTEAYESGGCLLGTRKERTRSKSVQPVSRKNDRSREADENPGTRPIEKMICSNAL